MNNERIVAFILARSGSKGLKDKNIKPLAGKPLIAYTIEAAIQTEAFEDVIVLTDSEVYADISRKYGAEIPFLRPASISEDTSTTAEVIVYALEKLKKQGREYSHFCLLQPTSPLRDAKDIAKALELGRKKKADSIVSVTEAEHPPYLMNGMDETLSLFKFLTENNHKRRQDFQTYYRVNGAIYLSKVDVYLKQNDFYGKKSYGYEMDKIHSIDIDDWEDFQMAEALIMYAKNFVKDDLIDRRQC